MVFGLVEKYIKLCEVIKDKIEKIGGNGEIRNLEEEAYTKKYNSIDL